mgnify:CR=1 FL=1
MVHPVTTALPVVPAVRIVRGLLQVAPWPVVPVTYKLLSTAKGQAYCDLADAVPNLNRNVEAHLPTVRHALGAPTLSNVRRVACVRRVMRVGRWMARRRYRVEVSRCRKGGNHLHHQYLQKCMLPTWLFGSVLCSLANILLFKDGAFSVPDRPSGRKRLSKLEFKVFQPYSTPPSFLSIVLSCQFFGT